MDIALSLDLLTGLVSFLLTLMVLSYLIGDNPAFRIAVYLFIGVSAGYAAIVAWNQVLLPRLFKPLVQNGWLDITLWVPLLLGLLLLFKLSPRTAALGNPSLAVIVGVGAAVAIGGAIFGTLFPLTRAILNEFDLPALREAGWSGWMSALGESLVMLVGTVSALVYFQFSAKSTPAGPKRGKVVEFIALVGQVFIAITFGVIFAGVFSAAMTALVERLNFLIVFVGQFF